MQLEHYEGILSGEREAGFLRAKKYRLDYEKDASIWELWKIHDEALLDLKNGGRQGKGKSNLLELKRDIAWKMFEECEFCERRCRVNRRDGKKGFCGVLKPKIASEFLHFGEEPMLVPSHTIFFTGCTFRCIFCQNWDIS